jgi:hypothetical protein
MPTAEWQLRLAQAINEGNLQASIEITKETGDRADYTDRAAFYNTYSAQCEQQQRRSKLFGLPDATDEAFEAQITALCAAHPMM